MDSEALIKTSVAPYDKKVTLLKIRYIRMLGKEGYEFVDVQCFISLFLYYPIPIYTHLFKGSLEALENL